MSVTENRTALIALQIERLRFATFVSACILGVHAKRNNTAIRGPVLSDLSDVCAWAEKPPSMVFQKNDMDRFLAQVSAWKITAKSGNLTSIDAGTFDDGIALADRLLTATHYKVADPLSLVVMAYQAMVLHGHQHAGASIALSAAVIEVSLQEIMHAAGQVRGSTSRFANQQPALQQKTPSQVLDMKLSTLTKHLKAEGVLDNYLAQRIDKLRNLRNTLMHQSEDATPEHSGEGLTVVRDVLRLCTGEAGFELNTGWSYRF